MSQTIGFVLLCMVAPIVSAIGVWVMDGWRSAIQAFLIAVAVVALFACAMVLILRGAQ